MNITLLFNTQQSRGSIADADVLSTVANYMSAAAATQEAVFTVTNMLMVNAFRVEKKLGNIDQLYVQFDGAPPIEIDNNGRWSSASVLPDVASLTTTLLIKLLE